MELTYGKSQIYTSSKMKRYPFIAKLVNKIFGYTNIGNYARATIFKKLILQLPYKQFKKILDLGTGYGEFAFMLANALPNAKITGLDVAPERIDAVNEAIRKSGTTNIDTHLGKMDTLMERNFDFIFAIDVFEHIEEDEMPFQEAKDALSNGGFLLVKIPTDKQLTILPDSWFEEHHHWLDDEHIGQVYDLEGLKNRFQREGFKVVHASYTDGFWSRLGWEIGYLSKRAGMITQLLFLPIAKFFVWLDRTTHNNKTGNAIQVIGQKIE
ncbi:MAG: class I SAM-dependent methyltransferase [Saprospiraceae bacterium]|nr:class I SAM-dependent methyltransferase [Saprospiraceae bacterium]